MILALFPTFSFADEDSKEIDENNYVLETPEEIATMVEDAVGREEIVNDIIDEGDFLVKCEETEIIIPESGNGDVTITNCENYEISMELPKEFSNFNGDIAGEGTVVYSDYEEDIAISVQALQTNQDDIIWDGFRSIITIESAESPHSYTFEFNLPKGFELLKQDDCIVIIRDETSCKDENCETLEPEILGIIEPAWAKDGNGDSVRTYYSISDNKITQTVDFNEESVFPIIVDPEFRYFTKLVDSYWITKYNAKKPKRLDYTSTSIKDINKM